jgi:hypothetical protein
LLGHQLRARCWPSRETNDHPAKHPHEQEDKEDEGDEGEEKDDKDEDDEDRRRRR